MNYSVKENKPELANCKQIIFQHGKARRHSSLFTRQKLLKFGRDLLPHPLYSLALAPSYLFRSLENPLYGKKFNNNANVHLEQFFTRKNKNFMKVYCDAA